MHITNFDKTNILVVGDVILDSYFHGNTTRISPEAPVPIVHVKKVEERAGGAANVALNVNSLGGKVKLLGYVGDDKEASKLENLIKNVGKKRTETPPEHRLSDREWEVALLVSKGNSNLEIAAELNISERTVKAHISSIFKKTNTESRLQLALYVKALTA